MDPALYADREMRLASEGQKGRRSRLRRDVDEGRLGNCGSGGRNEQADRRPYRHSRLTGRLRLGRLSGCGAGLAHRDRGRE